MSAPPEPLDPLPAWEEDEKPSLPGSPATPRHSAGRRIAYLLVGILVSATSGLGNAIVSANLPQIQGSLGLTPVQGAWLPAAYVMVNVSSNLILFKCRQQFGIQRFAEAGLAAYIVICALYLMIQSYEGAVLVRAIAGFAAAPMSALAIFYVLQAFPKAKLGQGLCVALGMSQLWVPVAWLLSPALLDLGDWQTLYLFEFGLALCTLAACVVLRVETQSEPEGERGCDGDAGQEVGGEFVVAGGDAAEIFETAEGVLNQVAAAVSVLVVADGAFAIPSSRNDGNGSGVT